MKIRTGFVSNSSSSSYICDVCGYSEYLWEPPYGFTYCCKGHGLCKDCFTIDDTKITEIANLSADEIMKVFGLREDCKWHQISIKCIKEDKSEDLIRELVTEDELIEEFCPICSFEVYVAYVCGELGKNTVKIAEEIKDRFDNYQEFMEFIR
jgi:hypothetical protein